MKLGTEVGRGPSHIVLDGDPAPRTQNGHSPQFSTHVRCLQTAGWIKMPLGTQVDLGPGEMLLDGDPAPHQKEEHNTPNFGACIVAKRLHGPRCHLVRE